MAKVKNFRNKKYIKSINGGGGGVLIRAGVVGSGVGGGQISFQKKLSGWGGDVYSGPKCRAVVEGKYNDSLMKLSKVDKFYQIKLTALKTEKQEGLEAVEAFEKKNKKLKRKRTIADYMTRREEAHKNNKIKSLIAFDEANTNSIKPLAVEKKSNINLTTRFMNGKMLMFANTSLQSFVYDMIDVFCFSDHAVQEIYKKYQIEKCYMYQTLTDTDSTSLFFIFICDIGCVVSEKAEKDHLR